MRRLRPLIVIAGVGVFGWSAGCGSDGSSTFVEEGVDGGETPFDPPSFAPTSLEDAGFSDGATGCAGGCPTGFVCVSDKCLPPQANCNASDAGPATHCLYDTYCDPATNTCVPFGTNGYTHNPACTQLVAPGNFAPKTKCEFPAAGAAPLDFPNHVDVQATPVVVRFGAAATPPSIVVPFTAPVTNNYTEHLGVIRVLRGTDCTQEAVIGGVDLDADGALDWARSSSSVAVADLDADGVPEIVAYMTTQPAGQPKPMETLIAFKRTAGVWAPLWATKKATMSDGVTIFNGGATPNTASSGKNSWASPSVHDLDDDGKPEIIREGWVFDGQTGRLRAGLPTGYATFRQGISPILADVDGDGKVELTNGAKIWEFNGTTNTWTEETYYSGVTTPAGWSAIADFDPGAAVTKTPELAVVTSGNMSIYKLDHTVFMGMTMAMPGGGGGPPTIADFDGDGLPEVGVAGQAFYLVFDPDCQATPRPGGQCVDRTHCDHTGGACPDKVLWSRATQDISSNVTGSSVFDFEADGKAEVVYADECFARVYSGTDGRVLFSRYTSSCTWNENPVVADVDGDFRAELVVAANTACGAIGVGRPCLAPPQGQTSPASTGIDTQFAGLVCLSNADCQSGVCDAGLCRCTTSAQCCAANNVVQCEEFGTQCAAPPLGTAGTGDTCRANHPHGVQGIRVYEDAADRWVRSRAIWSQHAYAVTHINEDGTVPKTSMWATNWTQSNLNNFRQNVPGTANANAIGDLTSQAVASFTCSAGAATLSTPICNRGTAPVGAGVTVGFYVGTTKVCSTVTAGPLASGACETVSCTWNNPPTNPVDVIVVPNDNGAIAQCNPDNDKGLVKAVSCASVN